MSSERVIKTTEPGDQLLLKVCNQEGVELSFKVKPTTPMGKLIDAFCARKGLERTGMRFMYNGVRINDDDTPKSLDMENEDIIDMMVEQTGGWRRTCAH